MESPFFSNYWNSSRPRYSPTTRGIPVRHQTTTMTKSPSPSSKVVSIPVHFVGSEKTRSAASLKIQKVFRGFLVRKNMKKIVGIGSEVDEIERRLSRREMVDLIRRDAKERLKVNEILMALLFRLDSVNGVDSGVRGCRKAVIRKAIALQERVDAIVTGDQSLDVADGIETKDQTLEMDGNGDSSVSCETVAEAVDQALEIKDPASSSDNCRTKDNAVDSTVEAQDSSHESLLNSGEPDAVLEANDHTLEVLDTPLKSDDLGAIQVAADQTLESQISKSTGNCDTPAENPENVDIAKSGGDSGTNADEEASVVEETLGDHNATPSLSEAVEESMETSSMENPSESSENSGNLIEGGEEETLEKGDGMEMQQPGGIEENPEDCSATEGEEKSNRDLMERMIEDNEKLMGLMKELFERNTVQTRLISSLSQRVELLEKALRSEKLRRKKKRHGAGIVERQDGASKCGRKS
ncbi:hypothetical protein HHK36_025213 [Tetracentron sinense]|uniref:BAG domain-containing protein n=1 Tax=Tetracentron sinense TaxID=13715 RepID=A0A834YPN7_TETSI|nr:hypothetical protein HHK36_025213 [Tetracentron sinense]